MIQQLFKVNAITVCLFKLLFLSQLELILRTKINKRNLKKLQTIMKNYRFSAL